MTVGRPSGSKTLLIVSISNFYFQVMLGEKNLSAISIMITDPNIRVEQQTLKYDQNSFIGDIGGFLGLLLGLSILDIYKKVWKYLRKVSHYEKRQRKKKRSKQYHSRA